MTDKLPQRFWDKVEFAEDGCWVWIGAKISNGYGRFKWQGRMYLAHRVSYLILVGPIPEELVIDHLCRVRHCVNPDHMELVTFLENVQRGERATMTHCDRGHLFDERNTHYRSGGRRRCLACERDRNKVYREKRILIGAPEGGE